MLHAAHKHHYKGILSDAGLEEITTAIYQGLPEWSTSRFAYWTEPKHKAREKHYMRTGEVLAPEEGWDRRLASSYTLVMF